MHIIKISTNSFKVILSRSDVEKYGPSAFDGSDSSRKMLNHILSQIHTDGKKTCGSITHAEFFEDKFGGGELFLRLSGKSTPTSRYIFSSSSVEDIIDVCRVISSKYSGVSSRLLIEDGIYRLTIFSKEALPLFTETVGEFGNVTKASKSDIWLSEEHGRVLIPCRAVETIIERFYKKA